MWVSGVSRIMESRPTPESPSQRPRLAWRRGAAISAGLLAGALFVGAHADALKLPLIELTPLFRGEKPTEVKSAHWAAAPGRRWASSASGSQYIASASLRQSASGGEMVRFDWPDAAGNKADFIADTLNQLAIPSLDMATGSPGSQSASLTSWPMRGMAGGAFAASGAGSGGGGSWGGAGRAQSGQNGPVAAETASVENQLQQPHLDAAPLDGPIPEPATWTTIILGLGLTGVALRGLRRRAVA